MKYENYGVNYELTFKKGAYKNNNSLAIQIMCQEDGEEFQEPFAMLTVNLNSGELPSNCAFVDSNNCPTGIIMNLIADGVAIMTTVSAQSGFCTYPLVKFSDEWLASLEKM